MNNLKDKFYIVVILVVSLGIIGVNLWLWDQAYTACLERGSSAVWCRITEEWQIVRFLFGF